MTAHVALPLLLLALPLAGLPWLPSAVAAGDYPWLELLPQDALSDGVDRALKILASVAIGGCILGLADPFVMRAPLEHVGRGAQIVVLLDRSRSMDQPFAGPGHAGDQNLVAASGHAGQESKGEAARRLLAAFARHREHDLMALTAFTTVPIRVTGFTEKPAMIQAAIDAGNLGRGLADTDIGRALLSALDDFGDRPYNGSRVILLVSDGGARLDEATRQRVTELMKRERVALYWLYLRARNSPGLRADLDATQVDSEQNPEHFLNDFFAHMGSPYHAYEAEDPGALARAMADVDRLQSLPIRYGYPAVRDDLSTGAYATALAAAVLLSLAALLERRPWQR